MFPARVFNILIPDICVVCGKTLVCGERFICLHCLIKLPRVTSTRDCRSLLDERVTEIGIPVRHVLSMFYYDPLSPYSRLIRMTKYRAMPVLGRHLGSMFARELSPSGLWNEVDMLIPVPMHFIKQWKRGYNQSAEIAKGIADVTNLPVINALKAAPHDTQTERGVMGRYLNASGTYVRRNNSTALDGKHIMLIDDVMTTGATVIACAEAIHNAAPNATVSILTLALTR